MHAVWSSNQEDYETRESSWNLKEENTTTYIEQERSRFKGRASEADRKCNTCGKVFKKISQLKIHKMTHTKVFQNLRIDKKAKWSEDRTRLICVDCSKEFMQTSHMKTHIAVTHYQLHNMENLETIDNDDVVKQENVVGSGNEITSDKKQLFLCEFCLKQFTHFGRLERHKFFKHDGSGLGYKCTICKSAYRNAIGLLTHMGLKHLVTTEKVEDNPEENSIKTMLKNKPTFLCELCFKQFARKYGLQQH